MKVCEEIANVGEEMTTLKPNIPAPIFYMSKPSESNPRRIETWQE